MNIGEIFLNLWNDSGLSKIVSGFLSYFGWQYAVMLVISFVLLYLAIAKKFEPLLLVGIAFGCLLSNLPKGGLYHQELWDAFMDPNSPVYHSYGEIMRNGGLLDIFYIGVKTGLYPCLIFMGVGAMTDFGPLLANPKSMLLGAAAQMGVFVAFFLAQLMGFDINEAASIGIIGGADGPTAIFLTTRLAPHLLGAIAVAAYSYMADSSDSASHYAADDHQKAARNQDGTGSSGFQDRENRVPHPGYCICSPVAARYRCIDWLSDAG